MTITPESTVLVVSFKLHLLHAPLVLCNSYNSSNQMKIYFEKEKYILQARLSKVPQCTHSRDTAKNNVFTKYPQPLIVYRVLFCVVSVIFTAGKRSYGKVMFLHLSVSHSVHRWRHLCMMSLPVWLPGPMFLPGDLCLWFHGLSIRDPLGQRSPGQISPAQRPPCTVKSGRYTHILLECILVALISSVHKKFLKMLPEFKPHKLCLW